MHQRLKAKSKTIQWGSYVSALSGAVNKLLSTVGRGTGLCDHQQTAVIFLTAGINIRH